MIHLKRLAVGLGREVLDEIRTSLGASYSTLTDEQKISIEDTAILYMELRLRGKAGEDVAEKLQAVASTVRDWKVWGEFAAEDAFWKGVQKVAAAFGTFLGTAVAALL